MGAKYQCLSSQSLLKKPRKPDYASEKEVHKTRPDYKTELIGYLVSEEQN